jgi:hypothetical protein
VLRRVLKSLRMINADDHTVMPDNSDGSLAKVNERVGLEATVEKVDGLREVDRFRSA